MKQVVIENPVLNSPFEAPQRHFKFDDEGITNEIVEARRISSYLIPVPRPKKRGKQLRFETEWTEERIRASEWINQVRARVDRWRQGNRVGITSTTQGREEASPFKETPDQMVRRVCLEFGNKRNVKNDHVGFTIPYTFNGEQENYRPDLIVRLNDGHGTADPLNLIVEVTGNRDGKKAAKTATARNLWVPAVNNRGGFGRWAFAEIADPWGAMYQIRRTIPAC